MAVIVSISGVVVALAIGWFSALRAQYDRVLEVLRYVSSDAVASARQQLGLIIHSERRQQVDTTARHDRIADLFVVLWAFGRIDAVRQTLPRWELPAFLGGGPLLLLKTNTKAWVMYWHTHLAAVLSALEPDVDIRGSDDGSVTLKRSGSSHNWQKRRPHVLLDPGWNATDCTENRQLQ